MIIATKNIDMKKIISMVQDEDRLCEYIHSIVPERYKHCNAIYHNTRYYINLEVLKSNDISMENKIALSALLTKNIRTVGYMGTYITCQDLEMRVNMNKVMRYYKGDIDGKSI